MERETDIHTYRHTYTDTERQTERQKEGKREMCLLNIFVCCFPSSLFEFWAHLSTKTFSFFCDIVCCSYGRNYSSDSLCCHISILYMYCILLTTIATTHIW